MNRAQQQEMMEELEDEFRRWMDRMPCYIDRGAERGVELCLKNFSMSARLIAQKHELMSQGKLK